MYTARYTLPILCRRCGNTLGVPSGKNNNKTTNNKTSKKKKTKKTTKTTANN